MYVHKYHKYSWLHYLISDDLVEFSIYICNLISHLTYFVA
jgi:hypothetical protein